MFRSATTSRGSDLCDLADEELMRLAAAGEMRAFEVIFDRRAPVAYSLAYRICGARPMVEDVIQEAFLSLWRSSSRYDSNRGGVRAWILSVVHNRAIDGLRRARVRHGRDVCDAEAAERVPAPERTDAEVALPPGTVKGRIRLALQKLRDALADDAPPAAKAAAIQAG